MEDLALITPSLDWEVEFREYQEDFHAAGETWGEFHGSTQDFPAYIQRITDWSEEKNLPHGFVPSTTYWLVKDRRILGESDLRHWLNPSLEVVGGHIGYSIRPTERRKGYGTRILALTLEKAGLLGLKRVLITCDTDNIGSARIIEKNGGVLTKQFYFELTGKMKSHYWVEIKA